MQCNCKSKKCHHRTGNCLLDLNPLDETTSNSSNINSVGKDRIEASQWVKFNKNSTLNKLEHLGNHTTESSNITVRTIIKPMIMHPYMNSTAKTYAGSYKTYMGKVNASEMNIKSHIKEIIEKQMDLQMKKVNAMNMEVLMNPEVIEMDSLEDSMSSDEKPTIVLEPQEEQIAMLAPIVVTNIQRSTEMPPVIDVLQVDHNHIIYNLSDHPEKSHSIDHPHHHDTNESVAIVTVSCLLLVLFILIMLAIYLQKVNRHLENEQDIRKEIPDNKKMAVTPVKIISEPLPSNV
jgi:hypothetical protein